MFALKIEITRIYWDLYESIIIDKLTRNLNYLNEYDFNTFYVNLIHFMR